MKLRFTLLPTLPSKRRDLLQLAIIINQLATPGLGSWLAGHKRSASAQLAIVLLGFFGFLLHLAQMVRDSWVAAWEGLDPPLLSSTLMNRSLGLIGIAWLWAGFTSLLIYREMRALDRSSTPAPPRLS